MDENTHDRLSENFAGGIGTGSSTQMVASILTGGASGAVQGFGDLFRSHDTQPGAADVETANLLKAQFADWQQNFQPIELQALNQISLNNPRILPDALDDARNTAEESYGSMAGVLERQNRGLGMVETPQQKATTKRLMDLNKAAAVAGAKNTTRSGVRQMDESLISGSTPNPQIVKG